MKSIFHYFQTTTQPPCKGTHARPLKRLSDSTRPAAGQIFDRRCGSTRSNVGTAIGLSADLVAAFALEDGGGGHPEGRRRCHRSSTNRANSPVFPESQFQRISLTCICDGDLCNGVGGGDSAGVGDSAAVSAEAAMRPLLCAALLCFLLY